MFCGTCGQENPAEAQFCSSCGAGLAGRRTPFPARSDSATGAHTLGGAATSVPSTPAPGGPSGALWRAGGSGGDVAARLDLSLGARATGGVLTPPGSRGGRDLRAPLDLSLGSARTGGGARAPAADDAAAMGFAGGDLVADRYEVKAMLGRGGMGAVYRVLDRVRGREVALKIMLPSLMALEKAVERFTHEAELSLTLANEHVVRVFDVGEDRARGLRFFTMELIQGMSLRDWVEEKRKLGEPLTPLEAMDVIEQLLDALAYAHKTTVHRDLKPENMMVTPREKGVTIKVLDFGIAKLQSARQFTSTSMALGTAYYMAPEQQTDAASVDHRADLYSVGVIFYELLTGRLPVGRFRSPSEERPALPRGLDPLVLSALETDPVRRPQTAAEFLEQLRKVRRGEVSGPAGGGGRKVAVAALVLLLAGGGAAFAFRDRISSALGRTPVAPPQPPRGPTGATTAGGTGPAGATGASKPAPPPVGPPRLTALAPAAGAILRGDVDVQGRAEGPIARVAVNGVPVVPEADGSFAVKVPGAPAIEIVGFDAAGKQVAKEEVRVVIDDERPKLELARTGRVYTSDEAFEVAGRATDQHPEATVLVAGVAYPLKDGRFQARRTLAPGENKIMVQATDRAGNEAKATVTVVLDRDPPALSVDAPAARAFVTNRAAVRVRGRLTDATGTPAHVLVAGRRVDPERFGGFETELKLVEGRNAFEVSAQDEAGNKADAVAFDILLDTKAPTVTLDPIPTPGARDVTITVAGSVDEDACDVTVDGLTAIVEGRRFRASSEASQARTFVVVARDQAGNESPSKLLAYAPPRRETPGGTKPGPGPVLPGPGPEPPPGPTGPSGPPEAPVVRAIGTIERIDASSELLVVKLGPGARVKTDDILQVLRGATRVGKIRVSKMLPRGEFSARPDRAQKIADFRVGDQVEVPGS